MDGKNIKPRLIRKTKGICPHCLIVLEASIISNDDKVYLTRTCQHHGESSVLISSQSALYEELYSFYDVLGIGGNDFSVYDRYTIYCTTKCNMNCPICVVNADYGKGDDLSISKLSEIFRKNNIKGKKISLFGGEPTAREDLPQLVSFIKKSGNSVTLFTNGLRLADYGYLKELKTCGLKDIYLQFDGFDRKVEAMTRGKDWLDFKLKTLENARKLDIPIVFEVTTSREYNFKEIGPIFNYALQNNFVRGICFRSYSMFGRKKLQFPRLLTEDIIAEITRITDNKVSEKEILTFTKILFIVAYILKFRCCFSHRYLIIKRVKNGSYKTMSDYFDIDRINVRLVKLLRLMKKNKITGLFYLWFIFLPSLIALKSLPCLQDFLKIILGYRFGRIFSNSSFGKSYFVVEFDSPCDPLTVELDKVCNTATIMEDGAILPSFYESSLKKEKEAALREFQTSSDYEKV